MLRELEGNWGAVGTRNDLGRHAVALKSRLDRIIDDLRQGKFGSEAAVSQGLVLPCLHELGWPVFDTSVVSPEYVVAGRRVDFALCHPPGRPAVFVEVKKVGNSVGSDRQLFEYAFHEGVPMAILTDGQEWSFYLPAEQGHYEERRVYKLDLLERSVDEAAVRLERYLQYTRVCSSEALSSARSDYKNVARHREIASNMPRAWDAILEEQDSLLLELLAEKVEDLCGYKPDLEVCAEFIQRCREGAGAPPARAPVKEPLLGTQRFTTPDPRIRELEPVRGFQFRLGGSLHTARSAREVMTQVLQFLAQKDSSFLQRFAARKHGKKRRYVARDRNELYPDRLDLAQQFSVEIVPGWWMGTNYSRTSIQKVIDLAREVAGREFRDQVQANVL